MAQLQTTKKLEPAWSLPGLNINILYRLFWPLLVLVIIRLWIQPIYSSFWLDETGTALLVRGTFAEMLEKCTRWVGQPTFYIALIWPFAQLPFQREIALRLPSL